jgi:hypothetical protein
MIIEQRLCQFGQSAATVPDHNTFHSTLIGMRANQTELHDLKFSWQLGAQHFGALPQKF